MQRQALRLMLTMANSLYETCLHGVDEFKYHDSLPASLIERFGHSMTEYLSSW